MIRLKQVFTSWLRIGIVILTFAYVSSLSGCSSITQDEAPVTADFVTRCSAPGVLRCFSFEPAEFSGSGGPIAWGQTDAATGVFVNGKSSGASLAGRVELDRDHRASGESSLKFAMPSRTGAGYAGQFYANFSDDYSIQFGEGESFYIQWRQRFSKEFLSNRYQPISHWKQLIVGTGNRPGVKARSCSQLELVVNQRQSGPAMYHSCRGKDGRSEAIPQQRVVKYVPDQWMTFQLHVAVGTWYKNDRQYHRDSLIELWVASEDKPSQLVMRTQYDLANTNPRAKYGKVWLLPYLSGKDRTQSHPDAYTWYDDLIVSRYRIADPVR